MNTCKNTKTCIVNVQFSGRMTTTNDMLHCDFQYRGLLHSLRHLRLPQPSRATVRKCNRQVGHTIHLRFVSGGFCYDVNPPPSLCVLHTCTHTYLYIHTYIHKYIHTYTDSPTYIHLYICIHIYLYTYIYTYIFFERFWSALRGVHVGFPSGSEMLRGRLHDAPRRSQEAPKMLPRRSRTPIRHPKRPQESPWHFQAWFCTISHWNFIDLPLFFHRLFFFFCIDFLSLNE